MAPEMLKMPWVNVHDEALPDIPNVLSMVVEPPDAVGKV